MRPYQNQLLDQVRLFKDKHKIEVPLYLIPRAFRDLKLAMSPAYPFSGGGVIWLKTPKTAGSSIENCLEDAGYLYMMKPNKRAITGVYSGRLNGFKRKYPEYWESAWKFAIVRNPYDRFVSAWKYLRATQDRPIKDVLRSPPQPYPRFGDWTHLTRTQTEALCDEQGRLIVDKVIHYESLADELNEVLQHVGLPPVTLPVVNKSRHRRGAYMDYFDAEAREMLENLYRRDFETFGYEFESMPA